MDYFLALVIFTNKFFHKKKLMPQAFYLNSSSLLLVFSCAHRNKKIIKLVFCNNVICCNKDYEQLDILWQNSVSRPVSYFFSHTA